MTTPDLGLLFGDWVSAPVTFAVALGGAAVVGEEVVEFFAFAGKPPSFGLARGALDSRTRRSCSARRSAEFSTAMRLISLLVGKSWPPGPWFGEPA